MMINKNVKGFVLFLSFATTPISFGGTVGSGLISPSTHVYLGVFGGWSSFLGADLSQYGTAFYLEDQGGPLAVDAFGNAARKSSGAVGAHVGIKLNRSFASWGIDPAIELEYVFLSKLNVTGNIINETPRLQSHEFLVTYPLTTHTFLINTVLNFNNSNWNKVHPFIGLGIGSALLQVQNAQGIQIAPDELINHYDSDTNDTAAVFAAQPKIGLSYDISPSLNVFLEYRFLYLSEANYIFGSAVDPGHVETSAWKVIIGSPIYYNMATIGVNFDV